MRGRSGVILLTALTVVLAIALVCAGSAWRSEVRPSSDGPPSPATCEHGTLAGVDVTTVTFVPTDWQLTVVPAAGLAAIQAKPQYIIINAGYFDDQGNPIGLLASGGRTIRPASEVAVLSGIFCITGDGCPIIRLGRSVPDNARLALQSGPLLVEPTGILGIRSEGVQRRRMVLVVRGHELRIVSAGAVGLRALAESLVAARIEAAINLDGGPSAALWVRLDALRIEQPPTVTVPWFLAWWREVPPVRPR